MRRGGALHKDIAQKFDISTERSRQIVAKSELEEKAQERSQELLNLIRESNDIGKKWPKDFILDALSFQGRGRQGLKRFLKNRQVNEVSLKDLMDFLIADREYLPLNRLEAMPAYREKEIGYKTYSSLVRHFSDLDLGDAFNSEWRRRLEKLMRHLSRSQQYIPSLLLRYLKD